MRKKETRRRRRQEEEEDEEEEEEEEKGEGTNLLNGTNTQRHEGQGETLREGLFGGTMGQGEGTCDREGREGRRGRESQWKGSGEPMEERHRGPRKMAPRARRDVESQAQGGGTRAKGMGIDDNERTKGRAPSSSIAQTATEIKKQRQK